LQENLMQFCLLTQKSDDGFFGELTEAAVKKFQELAQKPERKKADNVKIVKTKKITYNGTANGIVDENTGKEISFWVQNSWVKPEPEYRTGDFDDNGVKNNCGERGTDNHHPGTGITDFQKDLASIGAYTGDCTGCFDATTEAAVKLFQEKASTGELVDAKGKKADMQETERLHGYRNAVGDGATVAYARKSSEQGWKVAKADKQGFAVHFTFDDGPDTTLTPMVLDILKKQGVIATFFVKGERFAGGKTNPKNKPLYDILDRAKKEGHTIGSHTYSHIEHPKVSEEKVRENIMKPNPLLKEYLSPVLRLPYGAGAFRSSNPTVQAKNEMVMRVVKKAGFKHVLWDIDPKDWDEKARPDLLQNLLKDIRKNKGGIVLFHDVQKHTANNLEKWILAVKDEGHAFVPITRFVPEAANPLPPEALETP